MAASTLLLLIAVAALFACYAGHRRACLSALPLGGVCQLPALPHYYALLAMLHTALPALLLLGGWQIAQGWVLQALLARELLATGAGLSAQELDLLVNQVYNVADGILPLAVLGAQESAAIYLQGLRGANAEWRTLCTLAILIASGGWALGRIRPDFNARYPLERLFKAFLIGCSCIAIFATIGIIVSVLFEALRFFDQVPVSEFLFGLQWSPQIAIREGQAGASGAFGVLPLIAGTFLISAIAMLVAVPTGLFSAIYLAEYASQSVRATAKPVLEILAGIPTVVYGFFAALTVGPMVRRAGEALATWGQAREIGWLAELSVSSSSALAAGLVMGIMVIPFISSLADDVITAVPQSLRDGSYGLGATRSETIVRVVLPAALPGIVAGILLAVSRAIGETMIVVMAAGLAGNLTANPLESVTTVTVQIVMLLVGDQEFDSPKTLAAFALGLFLFVVTLMLNIIALQVVKVYRERYE